MSGSIVLCSSGNAVAVMMGDLDSANSKEGFPFIVDE